MARDKGLEELVLEELRSVAGITDRAMFGGRAWLLDGNLLCASRHDGLLARLGKGNDGWALATPGVTPMISRGKPMSGWVRADGTAFGRYSLRHELIAGAIEFVRTLPGK